MQRRKLWEKTLAWVLAVVCCLSIINLAPFAQKAKAANTTIYFHADDFSSANLWGWNGIEPGAWPGIALSKVSGTNGWWSADLNSNSFDGYVQETGGGRGCDKTFNANNVGSEFYVVYKNDTETLYTSRSEAEAAAGESISPANQITVTLVDGTGSHWLSGANDGVTAYFTANNVNMTKVDETHWTATIDAADTVTFRRGPSYSDGGWNSWNATGRGDSTTYTATDNGVGTWGTPAPATPATFKSREDFNGTVGYVDAYIIENYSGSFSTTSTRADVLAAGGRQMTYDTWDDPYNIWNDSTTATSGLTFVVIGQSDGIVKYQWLNRSLDGNKVFEGTIANSDALTEPAGNPGSVYGTPGSSIPYTDPTVVIDEMEDQNNGKNTLITVPAVMYNYLPGGGDGWWNQFTNIDRDIMTYYAGNGKMGHPLVLGAFGDRTQGKQGVYAWEGALFGFLNDIGGSGKYGVDNTTWYYNHNPAGTGYNNDWNGALVGAPIQGMVNEYLSTGGDLLSSENNVIIPFFHDSFLTGRAQKFGSRTNPIAFPFRDEGNGYYIFDSRSGEDNVYMGSDGKLVYDSSSGAQIKNLTDDYAGFFPFNTRGAATTYAKSIGDRATTDATTNFGFGARMDIPFTIPAKSVDSTGATPLASNGAANLSNSGNEGWVTVTLDNTLQPGDYILAVTQSNGGGYMYTRYRAGDGSERLTGDYENYENNASVGTWNTADFDGNKREVQNANGTLLFPLHVDSATNQIKFYGKTWNTTLNVGVYRSGTPAADIKPSTNDDVVFRFSGDDDLWVFVDGRLALDMGGSHGRATGEINFTTGNVTVNTAHKMVNDALTGVANTEYKEWLKLAENSKHQLTVFYMERGLYDSNLKIEFNFVPIKLSASDAFFAEMGTPVEIPLDAEFVGQSYDYAAALANSNFSIKYNGTTYSNVNDFRSAFGGTFTFDNAGKLTYKSNPQTEAFKDKFVITFSDGSNSEYEIEVNKYRGNDDVYVVDYGIPVELRSDDEYDLFANDKFSLDEAERVWESALSTAPNNNSQIASKYTATAAGLTVAETVTGNNGYGKAKVTDKANNRYAHYIYALDKFLDTTDTFYYASQVVRAGTENGATLDSSNATPIMTSKVTILPANVVYYEDNFSYYNDTSARAITYSANAPQVVDSTGIVKQSDNWDDLYGYDSEYENQYADSLGHAAALGNGTQVQFTFKGTGVDIISRTDSGSAAVLYGVYNASGAAVKFGMLDTKYT
ncbi:MAG: fibro-slime domain-containing protein, partial [Lachnospiraceae bacterium]|nr:fibro-slime domain-containing protein [Lachnospiraceae bacterium]